MENQSADNIANSNKTIPPTSSTTFHSRTLLLLAAIIILFSIAANSTPFYSTKGMSADDFVKVTYVDSDAKFSISENYLFVVDSINFMFSAVDIFAVEPDCDYTLLPYDADSATVTFVVDNNTSCNLKIIYNNGDYILYAHDITNSISIYDDYGTWEAIPLYSSTFPNSTIGADITDTYWVRVYPSGTNNLNIYINVNGRLKHTIPLSEIDDKY